MGFRTVLVATVLLAIGAEPAAALTLADGPVRITSALPTGSGPDAVLRLVAAKLQARWGRAVVVDARPGGAGVVAINAVKAAPPTGNDLLLADVGHLAINPLVFKRLAYDPEKDLVPVALLYRTVFFVTVAADGPYRSLKDLLAAARDRTSPLTYGSNAVGGPIHLASARLEAALQTQMLHVPYKETSTLYAAVSTGEVSWAFGSAATAGPLVRAGRLRLLAVADAVRSPALPDVPTLAEAGGPAGLFASSWVALMAPHGTPAEVVSELNQAINDALASPEMKERLVTFGFTATPGPARQVAELMSADRARYAEVLSRVKVSID